MAALRGHDMEVVDIRRRFGSRMGGIPRGNLYAVLVAENNAVGVPFSFNVARLFNVHQVMVYNDWKTTD